MQRWMTVIVVLYLGVAGPAQAEPELERAELAGLIKELDFLLLRVDELRSQNTERSGRLRFQYGDLRHDLELMREGISAYIEADLRSGRRFQPLRGEYR